MKNPLLPDRYPDKVFICDFPDVIPKSDIASMEHPLFTLSTKPDTKTKHYEHNGNTVDVIPSSVGHATIHDKDILTYVVSQIMKGINEGREPSKRVRFKAHDLLRFTNRPTGGESYKRLIKALERLTGTMIRTNIKTGEQQIEEGFGIIDKFVIVTESEENKRMQDIEVVISDWLFDSLINHSTLSISRKYFLIRKTLDRRIYELARKHCGTQKNGWSIQLKRLHKKSGSSDTIRKFRYSINQIIKTQHLPDYNVFLVGDLVSFYLKSDSIKKQYKPADTANISIRTTTYENIKKICRGLDVYYAYEEWVEYWKKKGSIELDSPDAAFTAFCKKKYETFKIENAAYLHR